MSDQNIEINLDELLKNVTIPTGNKEQQNDALDLPNVSVNPNNNISLDIPPLDFPKTNDISSLDDILMLSKHKEGIGKKERDASEVDLTLKEFPKSFLKIVHIIFLIQLTFIRKFCTMIMMIKPKDFILL